MKQKILLSSIYASIIFLLALNANAQGGTLPLNGSVNGAITSNTTDVWNVTTNADGLLRLTLHTASPADMYVTLYDNNGTILLNGPVESYNNSTVTLSTDGLAAGTYHVKVYPFSTSYGSYTLADSLFTSSITNDAEPDGSKATALTLALNKSKQGHLGYYYNNQRDTADWYKVTTNADGLLRISLATSKSSVYSTNGLDANMWLYDNDGTTQLGFTEVYSGGNATTGYVTVDGLAAGTYYIKLQNWNPNTEFSDYVISDSLFTSSIANDAEPNGSKATALTLPQNSSKGGHLGYYYNNQRDTADWYKVTTTQDGMLQLNLTTSRSSIYSTNGLDVNMWLYDIDGVTQLGVTEVYNGANPTTGTLNVDRLAAGTYYVKIQDWNPNSEFADYVLNDSLLTYNPNDNEPDDYASQATTIPANNTATGHISFYYNDGVKTDYADWFKVNYTGSGNLQFIFKLLPHLLNGSIGDVFFQVYKDTSASPIFNQEYYGSGDTSNTINLTSITQGYYWIKVLPYNSSPSYFTAYSINPIFTQVNIAKIKVVSSDTLADCSQTSSLVVKPSGSEPPYTLQLYRFGKPYGSAVVVNSSSNVTFSNLPEGSYYVTVYGDGATGSAYGKSTSVVFEPIPTNLTTSSITATSAKLSWTGYSCVRGYQVEYRKHGTATWTKVISVKTNYTLTGLKANTSYDWSVASGDSANKVIAIGVFADSVTFTTSATAFVSENSNASDMSMNDKLKNVTVTVMPNPAVNFFTINYQSVANEKVNAVLIDMNGRTIWSSGLISASAINGKQIATSQFGNGMYFLKIINEQGVLTASAKLVITK